MCENAARVHVPFVSFISFLQCLSFCFEAFKKGKCSREKRESKSESKRESKSEKDKISSQDDPSSFGLIGKDLPVVAH